MSPLLSQVVKYFSCHYNATVTNKIITSAITTLLLLTVSTAAAFAQQLPQQQKKGLVVVSLSERLSKLKASYIEYDKFAASNLHEGYFCYNRVYWINASGGKCMLVEDNGPDVLGKVSDVIAPHGCRLR